MTAKTYDIETSLTLDYRKSMWGLERIVLDSVSNHLPADSKGTQVKVELKQKGNYLDFKEANMDVPVEEVVFSDNGQGYDAKLLSVLFSTKAADAISVGQHGEGLKLVAAAALREGLEIEYNSRNWTAVPYKKHERIGGNDLERLCFRITENGNHQDGSRTVVRNPTPEFVKEVLDLPSKVLLLSDGYDVLFDERNKTGFFLSNFFLSKSSEKYPSKIIQLRSGKQGLFVKGVRICDSNSIFSYDLGINEIGLDRYYVNSEKSRSKIRSLLENCSNPNILERILRVAKEEKNGTYEEFLAFTPETKKNTLESEFIRKEPIDEGLEIKSIFDSFEKFVSPWVLAFRRVYGENALLANQMDTNLNRDAEIMGFKPVSLHYAIESHLESIGVKRITPQMIKRDYRWVSNEDLTPEERGVLEISNDLNRMYGFRDIPIRIFSGVFFDSGRESESDLGVWIRESNGDKYLGVKRELLLDPLKFADTYIHEAGHNESGRGDYDREFVDYFTRKLAENAMRRINMKEIGGSGI